MALNDFHGDTFVAFTDISGFRSLMRSRERALTALHHFYQDGFRLLRAQYERAVHVEGLLVSDCAVLFVPSDHADQATKLKALLQVIEDLNRSMLHHDLMLTTSIAYGLFDYTPRNEFLGIEKNFVHGAPYVEAYLDQSSGRPKLEPGQCRLLHEATNILTLPDNDPLFSRVKRANNKQSYFYWMCRQENQIEAFDREYSDAYNLKYSGMLNALKRNP